MLFTFVILFLTLGCDLAYGQEQKENEEVTVTLDFTGLNYGLKGNDPIKPPILNKGVIVQNVNFFLSGRIYVNSKYIRLSYWDDLGQIGISVPKDNTIKSISIATKEDNESEFLLSYIKGNVKQEITWSHKKTQIKI